jgi:ATP-dependent Lhr-like helicase
MTAPTGSGKTLAAFFWCLDQLVLAPAPLAAERCRVLYVSPLKALTVDVERNLRAPLQGLALQAAALGLPPPEISAAIRTGDTTASERREIERRPPDILITTPESLYLLLTSAARRILASVRWVIVDEIHSVAGTKRGAHLALSLERLEGIAKGPQRIGLSATQRPLEEIGRFLVGTGREVEIVDAGRLKPMEVRVEIPVDDMADLTRGDEREFTKVGGDPKTPRRSIWPAMHPRLLELIREHRSTIIFVNSRRLAERLAARLNELAGDDNLVRAHHGSIAKEQRALVEDALKAGKLRGIVATSSLELGIDMGAVDLVIQVEAPPSVSAGIQRIGRSGHSVGDTSRGRIFPNHRADLLESAAVVEGMLSGRIEVTVIPTNPLDVLAQQIVAMVALEQWVVADLAALVRRAYPFRDLGERTFEAVLDMLSGRYPSGEMAGLRPRIVWDRLAGTLRGRSGAQRLAVTSGGTIPDRGQYTVNLFEDGRRVGELDEEMVYEIRPGEAFILGASTWRVADITPSQVLVTPAPGEPARIAFWHGDQPFRPAELGRAIGEMVRELRVAGPEPARQRLIGRAGFDDRAASNLLAYLADQEAATGTPPDDRTVVVERFRDELGDWRVCLLTPFGSRVHAPWALAIQAAVRDQLGLEIETMHTDDGVALRLPNADSTPDPSVYFFAPEEIRDLVTAQVGASSLFAARFRENAARALLLPRQMPGQRTPLWLQRKRSHDLLQVASGYPDFPIVLETYRECLADVFDLDALADLMRDVRSRKTRVVSVETERASPFAASLMFSYIAQYIYDGDSPLAERRAQALTLDTDLLAELLGRDELRELLDPEAIAALELELQYLEPKRWPRDVDEALDVLRWVGDLTEGEASARGISLDWLAELARTRQALEVRIGASKRWIAAEDAGR